jgi:hypothetical protein
MVIVKPTNAGDGRFYVITNTKTRTTLDAVPFSRLTAAQKRLISR